MFLTNDYMQNLNYYNQNPYGGDDFYNNRTNGLCYRNSNNMNSLNAFNNLNNLNNFNNMGNRTNLNMLYPEIYRVIYPVVKNILDNTNISIVDEKFINSIVKNVLSILEGDNRVTIDSNINNNNNNNNMSGNIDNGTNNNGSNNTSNNSTNTNEENFLEELVKVIVVKEIISTINRLNLNSFIQNNML